MRIVRAAGLAGGIIAAALLAWNTAASLPGADFRDLTPRGRRYRLPIAAAIAHYLDAEYPTATPPAAASSEMVDLYRKRVARAAEAAGIRPWQFWRTIDAGPFLADRLSFPFRPFDDTGRVLLLSAAFRARHGIAPYLDFWLGTILCAPLLAWTAVELGEAGLPTAALVFPALFAASAYAVGALALTYSTAGFYVAGFLALVPWTIYALLGSRSRLGFAGKLALAALLFATCALCRSSCLFLLPGFLVALVIASRRVFEGGQLARYGMTCLAAAALVAPYLLLRPPQHHDVWLSFWEGLGDFDRTKGHYWSDHEALKVLAAHGEPRNGPHSEQIFRDLSLAHVREDPPWYAGILARRAWVTLSQRKLWPWGPRDGVSMEPHVRANEGAIDDYYRLTPTADQFQLGARRVEAPVWLLLLPTWLLPIGLVGRARATSETRRRRARGLAALALLGVSALGVPVLITTAGAIETETFVLVYLLGSALAIEEMVRTAAAYNARLPHAKESVHASRRPLRSHPGQ